MTADTVTPAAPETVTIDLSAGTPVDLASLPAEVAQVVRDNMAETILLFDYPTDTRLDGCCFLPQDLREGGTGTWVMKHFGLTTLFEITVANGAVVEVVRKNNSEETAYAVYYDHEDDAAYVIRVI